MVDISKLQPGDMVRIVDAWPDPEYGRQNNEGGMDKWLGKTMTVRSVDTFNDNHESYVRMNEDVGERYNGVGWLWFGELIESIEFDQSGEPFDDDALLMLLRG